MRADPAAFSLISATPYVEFMATIPRGGVCVAIPVLCLLYIWPFYSRRAPLISNPSTLFLFTGINQLGAVLVKY